MKRDKRSTRRPRSRDRKGETASPWKLYALKHALPLAAIIAFTFLAYSNSLNALFLFDNAPAILKDTRIHSVTAEHLHRILAETYWEGSPDILYRPLTTLSYLFNYAVLGNATNPAGYHWFNLILHAANIALVYALGLAIFGWIPAALLLSAVWGLHPVLTESVTNIVGRADMLAAFGVLAATLCYRMALRSSGARYAAWIAAIGLAITVGIFSKESAIVVVAVMALYEFTFEREISWQSRIPAYAAAAIPCLAYFYLRAQVIASVPYVPPLFVDNPLTGAGFWTARMTAVKVIGEYFRLLLWPASLSFDYSYNAIPLFGWSLSKWADWQAVLALIACIAAVVAAAVSWRRHKAVCFSLAFFFIALSPVSNLLILVGSVMGERFLYLPSVGFVAAVAGALLALRARLPAGQFAHRRAAGVALSVILIAFAARIYDRNRDWLDPQRFWRSAVDAAPGSYRARIGAASNMLMVTQDDWERSLHDVDRALAIVDGLPDLENTGNAYCEAGMFYRSMGERQASQTAAPDATVTDAAYWYRKSQNALLRCEKILRAQDGRYRLENAKRGKPGLTFMPASLYLDLGRTYARLDDPRHAIEAFERGRSLESNPDVLEELASAYQAGGDPRKAAIALVEAVAVDPGRTQLISKLVELYGQIDPKGCAVSVQGGRRQLDLECPLVHGDLCTASRNVAGNFVRRGQNSAAAEIRRTAREELGCAAGLL